MSSETLWNVRNLFYLGAYQTAINEAQELTALTDSEETERDFFVYRAYVALKKYEVSPYVNSASNFRSLVVVSPS